MEELLNHLIPLIIHFLEFIGVTIILISAVKTFTMYILSLFREEKYPVKQELAFSLALALEYKMGAEILKTVLIRDIQEIYILGAIIVLRALLSFLIHFELKEH